MKKHIVITEKDQGVSSRHGLYKAATQKNIGVWDRNKISGGVEALLISNDSEINNLIKLCEKDTSILKVKKVIVKNYQKEYFYKSFDIISSGL